MSDPAANLNDASARTERAFEEQLTRLVGSESFSRLLAQSMGTSMGLVRIANDASELLLRSLRVPTQGDLTRLGQQLNRLEDKLEDVLIAVERLEDRIGSTTNGAPVGKDGSA